MISNTTDFFAKDDLVILDVIDLLHFDSDLPGLRDRLQKLKKETFSPKEKIVILHFDSEYYYQNCPLGFQTHNLFSIWRSLDLPYSVMTLIHNQAGSERGIKDFIMHPADSPTVINVLVNKCSFRHIEKYIQPISVPKSLDFFAMCLMGGTPRAHRIALMQYLSKNNLLKTVKTSFMCSPNQIGLQCTTQKKTIILDDTCAPTNTVYSLPHRTKEDIFCQSKIPEINALASTPIAAYQDPELVGDTNCFYNKVFLDVVTETQFHSPNIKISEKTLRPLLTMTPFLLFAAAGTLAHLRRHGFETFSDFWDESYDNELDPHLRFLSCCNILKQLNLMSPDKIKKIYDQMLPILAHNRDTLITYINQQYRPLCQKLSLHD